MRVVLIGGGGHASDILAAIEAVNEAASAAPGVWATVAGIVADVEIDPARFASHGIRQLGGIDDLARIDATHFLVAVGYSQPRKALTERVVGYGLAPLRLIHPMAYVHPGATIGQGVQMLAGAVVSSTARIGDYVCLHHNTVIGHDCRVGDFATVLPGATVSGNVTLGEAALIGSGGVVIEGLTLGDGAAVGAGAVVTRNVPAGRTVKGVPAL